MLMWFVATDDEIVAIERGHRALVSVFLHHCYDQTLIDAVLSAKRGFDLHVESAWHLLIPASKSERSALGYAVDSIPDQKCYSPELAHAFAKKLELGVASLPCMVFRAGNDHYYFLKLGNKSNEEVLHLLREIGDLANRCHADGPKDPDAYRTYVNTVVVNYLRKKRILSALRSALPWLEKLLGGAVNIRELT